MGLGMLGPAVVVVTGAAAFFLWRRAKPLAFVSSCALIGVAIHSLGVFYILSWLDAQAAGDRIVEGKALSDAFFFLSALSGFWLALPVAHVLAAALRSRSRRLTRSVCCVGAFSIVFALLIPAGMYFGFAHAY